MPEEPRNCLSVVMALAIALIWLYMFRKSQNQFSIKYWAVSALSVVILIIIVIFNNTGLPSLVSGRTYPERAIESNTIRLSHEGDPVPFADTHHLKFIQASFFAAWHVPLNGDTNRENVDCEIHFAQDGRVLGYSITKYANSAAMNNSVREAIASVTSVTGIPPRFFERNEGRISVRFQCE